MAEKKSFWASLFGGSGCDCGMSIEEEKTDNKKPTKKNGGCCNMQIIEEPSCTCGEAGCSQTESDCDCDISEEKSNSDCCGEDK